ncbi:MAG TPA: FAD-dependent oxidoreductase [Chloroflexota bacterium]|nr:FAD-dependent oxidoreductase [Chloroflexota bacterium]
MSDVVVIGGGVSGVFTAYYLAAQGAAVTLIERATVGSAASYGNAGMLVPSYSVPMANPSAIGMGLRALVNQEDALKIRLRLEPAFWLWLARFVAACRPTRVQASTAVLCDLSAASLSLYDQLFRAHPAPEVGFARTGWLYAYRTEPGLQVGLTQARLVGQFAVPWQQLSGTEVHAMEPALTTDLAGGIYYPEDGCLDPYRLVRFVAELAKQRGATIKTGLTVRGLQLRDRRVCAVQTDDGDIAAETVVVAAGVLTPRLLRHVHPAIPIQPAKGYSLTFPRPAGGPRIPLNLVESHVVVSTMRDQIRLTGGLDLVGLRHGLDAARLEGIARGARAWLPRFVLPAAAERWYGFRPMTPDGLPVIGPLEAVDNLIIASGHGTLGVTLGPITGQLVAEMIISRSIPQRVQPLLPGRFAPSPFLRHA